MQRGEVVVRARLGQGCVRAEQRAQTLDLAERRGLEDVELRVLGEAPGGVVVAPVKGLHDLAHFRSFESRRSLSTRPPVWQSGQ